MSRRSRGVTRPPTPAERAALEARPAPRPAAPIARSTPLATPRWYAVHTNAGAEEEADEHIRRQGFMTFFPHQRLKLKRRVGQYQRLRLVEETRPYFSRYLFVALRFVEEPLSAIVDADGVASLVSIGDEPAEIPGPVMAAIMAWADETGEVPLVPPKPRYTFEGAVGEAFRFASDSAFGGLIGVIASIDGLDKTGEIAAWLQLLGAPRQITVPISAVGIVLKGRPTEPAGASATDHADTLPGERVRP